MLEERFGGDSSARAVEGTLLHELFQAALLDDAPSAAGLDAHAARIAGRHTERLLEVGLDERQARAPRAAAARAPRPRRSVRQGATRAPALGGRASVTRRPPPAAEPRIRCGARRCAAARRAGPGAGAARGLMRGRGAAAQALAVMRAGAPGLLAWLATFRRADPAANAGVGLGWDAAGRVEERMCVSRVVDIEEAVWAPRYGLKGMVDASVELGFAAGPPARPPRPAAAGARIRPAARTGRRCIARRPPPAAALGLVPASRAEWLLGMPARALVTVQPRGGPPRCAHSAAA